MLIRPFIAILIDFHLPLLIGFPQWTLLVFRESSVFSVASFPSI